MHTEKELELARRYLDGDCNDVQFNYIMTTEKMDKDRMERLIEQISYNSPITSVAKMMLIYIMMHFVFCLLYSLVSYIRV
jgi:hypothetical protein